MKTRPQFSLRIMTIGILAISLVGLAAILNGVISHLATILILSTDSTEIRNQANSFFIWLPVILLIFVAVSGGVIFFLLEKSIFQPLRRIDRSIIKISAPQKSGPNTHFKGRNELSDLSRYIDDMTATLLQSQNAIMNSERRFADIVFSSASWVFETDPQGRFTYCSDSVERFLGYTLDEVIGKPLFDFFGYESSSSLRQELELLTTSMNPIIDLNAKILNRNGEDRYILINAVPNINLAGAFLGYRGAAKDITEIIRVRDELRHETELITAIYTTSHFFILLLDVNGKILHFNPHLERVTGTTLEEMRGVPWFEQFIAPDEQTRSWQQFKRTAETGVGGGITNSIITHTGEKIEVEWFDTIIASSDGSPMGILSVGQDITERHRMEIALRFSEEMYRLLVENASEGISMIDGEGRFLVLNNRAAEYIGVTIDQIKGHKLDEFSNNEPTALMREMISDIITSGEKRVAEFTIDIRGHKRWLHTSSVPLSMGELYGTVVLTLMTDLTEYRLAQEALAQHARQNEQLLTSISSIMICLDQEGCITRWNEPAEITLGFSANDVLGLDFFQLKTEWDLEALRSAYQLCKESGENIRLPDINFRRTDGKVGTLGFTMTPYFIGEQTTSSGILILGTELSERRIMEMQLAQAQKLKSIGQLAAGIAHEINTPIQYVSNNLHFLQTRFQRLFELISFWDEFLLNYDDRFPKLARQELDEKKEEIRLDYLKSEIPKALQQSLQGVDQVSKIVQAMKEYSHPGTVNFERTDLNRAIRSVLLVTRTVWKRVAEVETDLQEDLPAVLCLPVEINQVFVNIITNAAHAITEKNQSTPEIMGKIIIKSRLDGEWVEIRISDTGTGIPAEIRKFIFDPFFTTKEVGKGTGQGLSITHHVVVEKHAGDISFETKIGEGTTFILRLRIDGPPKKENVSNGETKQPQSKETQE